MSLDRRRLLAGIAGLCAAAPARGQVRQVFDGAGRTIMVPETVTRVFPAGPPAAILLYTLAPELLIGWPRANREAERAYLLPEIGARPEIGRLTGRGNTANLEVVVGLKPDLILDVGSTSATYISLADRVQAGLLQVEDCLRHDLLADRHHGDQFRRGPIAQPKGVEGQLRMWARQDA